LLSMHWIVASHRKEGAVSVSVAGKTCRPTDATTVELPRQRANDADGAEQTRKNPNDARCAFHHTKLLA